MDKDYMDGELESRDSDSDGSDGSDDSRIWIGRNGELYTILDGELVELKDDGTDEIVGTLCQGEERGDNCGWWKGFSLD